MPRMRKSPHPKTASLSKWRCFLSKCHCPPPDVVVAVKALACEIPPETGLPLSRFGRALEGDLARR